jgi:hypothetical protein
MADFAFGSEITRRGGEYKRFSHGEFLDQKPDLMKRGHCYGLTLVWLSRYVRDRRAGADLLGNLNFTQASKDPQTIMIIRQIQNMGNSRTLSSMMKPKDKADAAVRSSEIDAVFGQSDDNMLTDIMKSLNIQGVRFYGVELDSREKTDSLLGLMGRMSNGLYSILLGNHVVGAIVDRPKNVFKFLDVNYGQGVWKTKAGTAPMAGPAPDHGGGFMGFLEAYFADPEIRLGYAFENHKGVLGYASAPLP